MKKFIAALLLSGAAFFVQAADYVIDHKGAHAFIQFKISHLGYSWLYGRFNTFQGEFTYDEANPAASKVQVVIDTASIDSNHGERDKHLRSNDFLAVKDYPEAKFVSKKIVSQGKGKAKIIGDFTLRGVTREITIDASHVGGGKDPWGGFRRGFEGSTKFALKDFGIPKSLGAASEQVEIILSVEGVRK